MNIETLLDNINLFNSLLYESGFKRDIQDYVASMPNNQSNIVTLREVAEKVKETLNKIYTSDLPEALKLVLPLKALRPFTETDHLKILSTLLDDKEVPLSEFYNKLNNLLTNLNTQIDSNKTKLDELSKQFQPYITQQKEIVSENKQAILSLLFRDKKTITSLKEFSKIINLWNRTIPIYHQLLSSSSPEDIEIVEIQNGSIDLVINLNFDIAINLIEVIRIGVECYLAYLSYKNLIKPIQSKYFGNKKLLDGEAEREKELLNNILITVTETIKEQHDQAKKADKKIDDKSDKKIQQVANLLTTHIIRGNDVKLLSVPQKNEENSEKIERAIDNKNKITEFGQEMRNALKSLPAEDVKKLLEKYGSYKEDEEQSSKK